MCGAFPAIVRGWSRIASRFSILIYLPTSRRRKSHLQSCMKRRMRRCVTAGSRTIPRHLREERACRRSEVRLGKRLLQAGVEGAAAALERAQGALAMRDDQVGVVVDWKQMQIMQTVAMINELPVPAWLKRLIARRRGVQL
jgi:hypothetical protein